MYWLIPLIITLVTFGMAAMRVQAKYGNVIPSGIDLMFALWSYGGASLISLGSWFIWALATRTG